MHEITVNDSEMSIIKNDAAWSKLEISVLK